MVRVGDCRASAPLAASTADRPQGQAERPPGEEMSAVADLARVRMEAGFGDPCFLADWERALFLHFEVDADALQEAVPYQLDLWAGETAVISLVAFTMRGMRPAIGGNTTRWLFAALATHEFLNARTYVRGADGERGIYFIAEWLPNRLARCVGPLTYGLPYRLGSIDYRHDHERAEWAGDVVARRGTGGLSYRANVSEGCDDFERRDFLLERYTAFTAAAGLRRKFRVWHEPWNAVAMTAEIEDASLLDLVPGCRSTRLVAAHYAAGVKDVWMGRPRMA